MSSGGFLLLPILALSIALGAGCTTASRAATTSDPVGRPENVSAAVPPPAVAAAAASAVTIPESYAARAPGGAPADALQDSLDTSVNGQRAMPEHASATLSREPSANATNVAALTAAREPVAQPPSVRVLPPTGAPPPSGGYRLLIPSAGIDAPVVEVGTEPDGTMASPDGPDIVGWFAAGPRPGGPGNVLMDGHVDWADRATGIARNAVFWNLKDLDVGHELAVAAGETRFIYQVRESLRFAYDDPSALLVLAPSRSPLLTLITCEGNFSAAARNYSHRRVIIAELTRTE